MDKIQRGTPLVSSLVIVVFVVLLGRLFYIQVLNFQELGSISTTNSIRRLWIQPPRGRLIDKNGVVMVDNQPLYSVKVIPGEFNKSKTRYLARLIRIPAGELADKIEKGYKFNRFTAATVSKNIDQTSMSRLSENLWKLPGVLLEADNKRKYRPGLYGSHLFGYLRPIGKEQLEKLASDDYSPDDKIGYSGLEKFYEERLSGQKGARFEMINPLGKFAGKYNDGKSDIPAIRGDDLYLSIDSGLQQLAEELLRKTGKSGAVVALDPSTGGVLALASAPDYDLEIFNGSTEKDEWNKIISSPQKPLFNRTVQAVYPPGSIYKMILAMAALEEKAIDPSTKIYDSGSFTYGNRQFRNHGGQGLGQVDMTKAIVQSSNVYFFNLIFKTGFESWSRFGKMFGFGEKTGIDLPGERSGLLPSPAYYNKRYGIGKWTKGNTISLAIGQGELGTTPVQLATYVAAIANNGTWHQPHIVKGYRDTETGKYVALPYEQRKLPISEKTFAFIKSAMRGVVLHGTGTLANIADIPVAGKTGTAQNPHGQDHAWFIAFAPLDHPKIAIAVLVENAGYGGSISAPIARELIKYSIKGGALPTPSGKPTLKSSDSSGTVKPDSIPAPSKIQTDAPPVSSEPAGNGPAEQQSEKAPDDL
ncbi:MAG: penicillin-binding protein 2 [Chlorobiaceae bacterium]|jgi:penicillin-binding protein 2|nr:penicillin-binding protein 2 [Chlorobiaceae bacterium]